MISLVIILFAFFNFSFALPRKEFEFKNVITVPSHCPEGQELVNGQCQFIWRWQNNPDTADLGLIDPSLWYRNRNVITVPPNCPPGQQWTNGACRDVWRHFAALAPTTPISNQFEYSNWDQRKKRQVDSEVNVVDFLDTSEILYNPVNRNIINIPNQCPIGYRPDAFGICRQVLV